MFDSENIRLGCMSYGEMPFMNAPSQAPASHILRLQRNAGGLFQCLDTSVVGYLIIA